MGHCCPENRGKSIMAEPGNSFQFVCPELAHDIANRISLAKARYVLKLGIMEAYVYTQGTQ